MRLLSSPAAQTRNLQVLVGPNTARPLLLIAPASDQHGMCTRGAEDHVQASHGKWNKISQIVPGFNLDIRNRVSFLNFHLPEIYSF